MKKTKRWRQQRHLARREKSRHRKATKPDKQAGYYASGGGDEGLFAAIFGRYIK